MVTASIFHVGGSDIKNPPVTSALVLKSQTCGYYMGVILPEFSGACNSQLTVRSLAVAGITTFSVQFIGLLWTYPSNNVQIRLSFSGPTGYMIPNFTTTNSNLRYPSSSYSAETGIITLSNDPANILFLTQPPGIVYIGNTFRVSVECILSSGAVVANQNIKAGIKLIQDTSNLPKAAVGDLLLKMASGSKINLLIFL